MFFICRQSLEAKAAVVLMPLFAEVQKYDVIGIDEGQFVRFAFCFHSRPPSGVIDIAHGDFLMCRFVVDFQLEN